MSVKRIIIITVMALVAAAGGFLLFNGIRCGIGESGSVQRLSDQTAGNLVYGNYYKGEIDILGCYAYGTDADGNSYRSYVAEVFKDDKNTYLASFKTSDEKEINDAENKGKVTATIRLGSLSLMELDSVKGYIKANYAAAMSRGGYKYMECVLISAEKLAPEDFTVTVVVGAVCLAAGLSGIAAVIIRKSFTTAGFNKKQKEAAIDERYTHRLVRALAGEGAKNRKSGGFRPLVYGAFGALLEENKRRNNALLR